MGKQLLIEYLPFVVRPEMIRESMEQNNGKLIVQGVLQRANARNHNGRVYPKNILEREMNRYAQNEIAQRRALGELDHADTPIVNLRNVSHNILECRWEGDDLVGKIEILGTPSGNILKELFRAGISVGISSRALGSVKPLQESEDDDTMEVQGDLEIMCYDFVSSPSTHGAFPRPISEGMLREGIEKSVNEYAKAETLIRDIICELSGTCCI